MNSPLARRGLLRLLGAAALSPLLAGAARAEVSGGAALPFAQRTPVRCGEAALRVRNLEGMVAFYRDALGLRLLEQAEAGAVLGVPGVPLLHLLARPDAPFESHGAAGLFHTAFLMPTREDLARWLVHAALTDVPLAGFADHSVSEAIYLSDPEGNGIEVYSDRPPETWDWTGGVVTMGTRPLDLDALLALATPPQAGYLGAPAGLRIGHMHLRVGDIPQGRAFYETALGLDSTRGSDPRSAFLASGGYHHHLALNIWNSAGAGRRDPRTTGLDWFSLQVADAALLSGQAERLALAEHPVAAIPGGLETRDPWGTTLRLVTV